MGKKIFYTVQSRKAWQNWRRQGYLQARDTTDKDFRGSYAWMKEQMKLRLPKYDGEAPTWLWDEIPWGYRTWSNDSRKKFVLLTIELDEADVLASDYNGWHWVLNDYMNSDAPVPGDWPYEKVFDLPYMYEQIYDEGNEQDLQYTTGRIELSAVRKVKYFSGRNSD